MSVSKDPVRGTYYVQCWFEDFSWEGIEFPADFSREELLSCGFVDRKENVVLYGGSGNGKTHTAVALGLIACSQGRRMLFKETSKLILELSAAHREGGLKQKLDALGKCDLIILDERGYIPCDPDGAKLLFRVISMCYEKISLLFTTNIDFSRWGRSSATPTWPGPCSTASSTTAASSPTTARATACATRSCVPTRPLRKEAP